MDTRTHSTAPRSDDLLGQEAITQSVQDAYRAVVGATTAVAARLYDPEQLAQLPAGAITQALGVGNPVRGARLRPGEIVIDLGCGGGIDTILAARAVAPGGTAIGLDLLPEMLTVAARNAASAGVTNVRWLQGAMENIPLPDGSVDVIVSNGVVNLSPRKSRVFAEMFRILRPGGRFSLADIVLDDDLPPEIATNPAAWAG
ncbi:MAG TPA: methyltransferase domain-containing protein [bacterium]|nr:methyltransferase domain-containing protein [bacterium]